MVFVTSDASLRPWRTIAQELAKETRSKRIVELSNELTEAVEAQGWILHRFLKRCGQKQTARDDGVGFTAKAPGGADGSRSEIQNLRSN